MDYQAITFLTTHDQPSGKRSNDSLVPTWHTTVSGITYPYVGKVKHFLTNVPPRALDDVEERQAQAIKLLNADWFDYVGRSTNALQVSVFSKRTPSDPSGNLWE